MLSIHLVKTCTLYLLLCSMTVSIENFIWNKKGLKSYTVFIWLVFVEVLSALIRLISLNSRWILLWFFPVPSKFCSFMMISHEFLCCFTCAMFGRLLTSVVIFSRVKSNRSETSWCCVTVVGIRSGSAAFGLIMRELGHVSSHAWLLPHCPLSSFLSITVNCQHHDDIIY